MRPFVKKISEFTVAVSIAAAAVLVTLGFLIIARPELISTIITYGIGVGCILLGITFVLSVIRSAIESQPQKTEQ